MAGGSFGRRVAAVRRFNRFYTQKIGVLREGLLDSPFSLAEARVLYELARRDRATAVELVRDLGLDAGYLSRILRRFEHRGLLDRRRSAADARRHHLSLTRAGRAAFAPLERRSRAEIGALLAALPPSRQRRLVEAMAEIARILEGPPPVDRPWRLRQPRPGDLGWVVQRHGALYAREYGFDRSFEALVAEIVAGFVRNFDAARERCWIAERDGENVGSVFLVRKTDRIAKLRLFLVEPGARGLGIGAGLVADCVRFARAAGYRRLVLWTQSNLLAARHLYRKAGFRRTGAERHRSFGQSLTAETWELTL